MIIDLHSIGVIYNLFYLFKMALFSILELAYQ